MLVLSRKARQEIIVGECVTVTVLGIHGDTVRIGIKAPDDMPICRGELSPETKDAINRARWGEGK